MDRNWQADLERWLTPFSTALRHKTRARMCPAYIAGLIGPGDRKSIQPMAARTDAVSYDQLHHFIGSGVWDAAPLEAALLVEADKLVGGGLSDILCLRRIPSLIDESVAEDDGELRSCLEPFPRRPFPVVGGMIEHEI
jgi:hypothetical protein